MPRALVGKEESELSPGVCLPTLFPDLGSRAHHCKGWQENALWTAEVVRDTHCWLLTVSSHSNAGMGDTSLTKWLQAFPK